MEGLGKASAGSTYDVTLTPQLMANTRRHVRAKEVHLSTAT